MPMPWYCASFAGSAGRWGCLTRSLLVDRPAVARACQLHKQATRQSTSRHVDCGTCCCMLMSGFVLASLLAGWPIATWTLRFTTVALGR